MKKEIRKFKKKKIVTIFESKHKVEFIFLENGLHIGEAFHVCFDNVNLLDIDFILEKSDEAVDVYERENPNALKKGYASFVRYDYAPESEWHFLGYTSGKEEEEK